MPDLLLKRLSDQPDLPSLVAFLGQLPPEKDRSFETLLTRAVGQVKGIDCTLMEVLEHPSAAGEVGSSEAVRYAAFYGLNICYRRSRDISKLGDLIRRYESIWRQHPTFSHLKSIYLRSTSDPRDMPQALQEARIAAKNLSEYAGVLHSLAEILINLAEQGTSDGSLLEEARTAIDKALSLDNGYPKFHATKGRLLALEGDFQEAMKLVEMAIDMEDSRANNYSLRVGGYQSILANIQMRQLSCEMNGKVEGALREIAQARQEVATDLQEARRQNLEFLGIFAAIVSFTIGGLQLAIHQSFLEAAYLLIALSGSLLCVYAGLGIIISSKNNLYRTLILFIIGAVMILGPLLAYGKGGF